MRSLADGAVVLPPAHLSARIAWHDTDWTGRVCAAPAANHACGVLKNVKSNKDADEEQEDRGTPFGRLPRERVPPCVFERAGFMRPRDFTIIRQHAYAGGWTRSHTHFDDTPHHMPAYSLEATPYRWVMRDEAAALARTWGIDYDGELEEAADRVIETRRPTTWVQDQRNQLAMLDSFFSGVVPGRSLVFLYAKDMPLLEERQPGARVLLGVGRVDDEVGPAAEWRYRSSGPLSSVLWERAVRHTIRDAAADGFLLPYHRLLADERLAGRDLTPYVALAPSDRFDEFSYVTERVSDDGAIAALEELARVVELLPEVADGPWDRARAWLEERLADSWEARGAYPGLGSVLAGAGLERGLVIAHRVVASLDEPGADPWPALARAIADAARGAGPVAGLVGRTSRLVWERIAGDEQRYATLRLLARFALSGEQARRLLDRERRGASDRELLENPYLIYELGLAGGDPVGFATVDRGLFPSGGAARAALARDPLPEPVDEAADDRRVRAACVSLLERAAEREGHTLLDEPSLRKRLAALRLEPLCDPTNDQFEIAADHFDPALTAAPLADGRGRGWQLRRLAQATALVADDVRRRIEGGPIAAEARWRDAVDAVVDAADPAAGPRDVGEAAARDEKARALETLACSRIAVLVGPAGSGKTMLLKALCVELQRISGKVLLLAPTGKARVQLGESVDLPAQTLAQFLRSVHRWDPERGYHLTDDGIRRGGYDTVIVDETSMLTEEMLAALVETLIEPTRLILCGDHRQLPPIGAGRPFADLVAYLRALPAAERGGGGLAELTVARRQRARDDQAPRDDLAVAACFSTDGAAAGSDEAFARVVGGGGDGTVSVVSWGDEAELHEQLVAALCADAALGLAARDSDALLRSLGATAERSGRAAFEPGAGGRGAERWQLLSPVRARLGGIADLNRLVRATWRAGDVTRAHGDASQPGPLGADGLLAGDKVMCAANGPRDAWRIATRRADGGYVANGEIGIAVGGPRQYGRATGLWVELSTQPGVRYTYWSAELNGDAEGSGELLEVAYAITVHKAQGSQFERTFVVVPNPCPLLSPELLYTALTRHRSRVTLLVQGDPRRLFALATPARSETARRLTCLLRAPDPFTTVDGRLLDGAHVHRSANGEPMRSKSEVIVANTLRTLGVEYAYEELLEMPDGSVREPDFTIRRPDGPTVYWEHLGMLDLVGYRADWEAKRAWYASHGILPWTDGGGEAGVLVWSTEGRDGPGIESDAIERLAREALDLRRPAGSS
jgi:AAA domain/UvrD-like helicase C-terminal domain